MSYIAIKPELKHQIFDLEYESFTNFLDTMNEDEQKIIQGDYTQIGKYKMLCMRALPTHFTNNVRGEFSDDFFDNLDDILEWYKSRNPFCAVGVIPGNTQIDFVNQLTQNGFKLGSFLSYWVQSIEGNTLSDEILDNIQPVSSELVDDFVSIGTTGFEVKSDNPLFKPYATLFRIICRVPSWDNFLFFEDDKPVGTGSLGRLGDFAYLANGSVLPEYRGKQIQQSLIKHRMARGQSKGAKYAITATALDSTSGRNMQRLGFQLAFVCQNYVYEFEETEN